MRRSLDLTAVLDGAEHIIATDGIDALSMRRLGTDLNISFSGLYVYVPSRDAILLGLIARKLGPIMPDIRSAVAVSDPLTQLHQVSQITLDMLRAESVARIIGREIGSYLLDGHTRDPELLVEYRSVLRNVCQAWAQERAGTDPREIAAVIRGAIFTTMYDSEIGSYDDKTWSQIRDRVLTCLRSAATA